MVASEGAVAAVVLIGVFAGLIFAAAYTYATSKVSLEPSQAGDDGMARLNAGEEKTDLTAAMKEVKTISEAISTGANAFLFSEYKILSIFIVVFGLILLIIIGTVHSWTSAVFTVIAFVVGACTSVLCGFIGMRIAVYANARTAASALHGYGPAFVTSFKAGAVMGFALTSLGCLILYILLNIFRAKWSDFDEDQEAAKTMFEALAGYGLGGSSIALFGRVGGGIYTKAADVGADLVGKVEQDLPEDDPRNPAVIADNVGDNVGDIAGMGADLFGSFAESACAAMVVASQSDLHKYFSSMCFPLVLAAVGILMCILSSFFSTHMCVVKDQTEIEPSLKRQIYLSTIFITPAAFLVCHFFLPSEFNLSESLTGVKNWHVFICVLCGLYSGMIIGIMTEVYTSHSYKPVRAVAHACETGAATNIIYGLALGYESVIVPVFCLAITIYVSYSLAGMFGIACGALGILAPLSIDLTIDAYGPICDNAGGIAEMAHLPPGVRDITDALDAAGNTTAAIGKGFAIGSAALVSLALFGAYVTTVNLGEVDILQPFQFAGLLVGAMLPYWFSAMTMKSVGTAAQGMVKEVRRQFQDPEIRAGTKKPDYAQCVAISTQAALKEMIAPGALVIFSPILVGYLFGTRALAGLLAGALVSGVQMAVSASNTGGAWDNAKKYIAAGGLGEDKKKNSEPHKAAVIGDTVGDPLKDTSGPSLNILIKLMAIISVVLASTFSKEGLIEKFVNWVK